MRTVKLLRLLTRSALAMLALLLITGTSAALAKTIYVDTGGNDAFDGTTATFQGGTTGPVATIGQALALAVAGDVISIEAGLYDEDITVGLANIQFEARIDPNGGFTVVRIGDGAGVPEGDVTINASGITMGNTGAGSFEIAGDLWLQSGSLAVAAGKVELTKGGITITRTAGSLTGTPAFPAGAINVVYNGATSVTAGSELPADLNEGDLTVAFTAANQTLTLAQQLEADDVTVTANSTVAGTIVAAGNTAGNDHDFAGGGTLGSVLVSQNSTLNSVTLTDALTMQSGSVTLTGNATVGSLSMVAGTTLAIGGNTLSVTGDFVRTGGTVTDAGGTLAFTGTTENASFSAGPNFAITNLVVTKGAQTVTLNQDVTVNGDLTINSGTVNMGAQTITIAAAGVVTNNGTLTTAAGGGVVFTAAGATLQGSGNFGNLTILVGANNDVVLGSDVNFTGILSLSTGGIDANGNDISPSGANASVVRNLAVAGTDVQGGTFNADNVEYNLELTGNLGGGTIATGGEFETDDIRNLLVTATNGTVNAVGAPNGTISGTVTLQGITENGDVAATTLTVEFPATVTIAGMLTVGESTALSGAPSTITLQAANNVVNGVVDGDVTLVLDGTVTVTGNSNNADFLSQLGSVVVNDNDAATITGIQQITGDLTTNAGSTLSLTLAGDAGSGDLAVGGNVVLNGALLTLGSNVDVAGTTAVNNGILAFDTFNYTSTGDFSADTDVTFTANGGALVFDTAANLALNGRTLPNLRITGVTVTGTQNAVISNSLVETGAGMLALGANTLSLAGTVTSDGGTIVTGTGLVTINNTTATLSGNATIAAPVTVADANTLTVVSNDEATPVARTLTVDGVLTVGGTIALGINSLTLADAGDNLVNDTGVISATSGVVTVNGGNVEPGGSTLDLVNFTTSTGAVTVGAASDGTLRITGTYIANTSLNENDANDNVVFADGATIVLNTFPALIDVPGFEGMPNLDYNVAATTGNEMPANGQVANMTVDAPVVTDQAVTVNGTLALNAAIDNTTNTQTLTLASGATLFLGIDNAAALATAQITATNYGITYGGPSDTISDSEFLPNATVNTVTINTAAPANTITLDKARTLNNFVQSQGIFDMNGFGLGINQNLTLDEEENLLNNGADANLSFVGASDGMISLNSDWVIDDEVDVVLNKSTDQATVTLMGGIMDFTNDATGTTGTPIVLTQGVFETSGSAAFFLFQNDVSQGFTQTDGVIAGNVRKRVQAGDPFAMGRSARFEYPVGDTLGNERSLAATFRTNLPTATNITVNHEAMNPGGTAGLPITSTDPDIGGYPDWFWSVDASTSLGPAQLFDLELTGTEPFDLSFEDEEDLKIIRRFEGNAEQNPWALQGDANDYSNLISVVSGDTTVVVRALNTQGGMVTQGARFTIGFPARVPVITYTDTTGVDVPLADTTTISVDEGETLTVDVQYDALDAGQTATLTSADLPDFATLTDAGDGTATLTLEPGFDDAGTYTPTLTATDPEGTTTVTFTIVVNEVNQPIEITGQPADTTTILSGRDFTFTLSANDPEGGNVTFTLDPDTLGATLTTTDSSATFSFIPELDQVGDTLTFTVNVSDGTTTVPVTFTVIVEQGTLVLGDVTLNGEVTAFDAATLLRHVTGEITLNSTAETVADVSGDGTISAFDAALILQYDVEIITCFPAEPGCVAAKTIAAATGELAWGEVEAAEEATRMYIPVSLAGDVSNVYSVELTASIDQELAEVVSVSGTRLPEGWQIAYAVSESGELKIAMAGTKPLANAGEIARIALNLVDENAEVSVTAEGNINENGVAFLGEIAAREIPTEFELGSNYPNPFNPTTTFTYSLPETGKVMIQIFDITGRRVRLLVNEEKDAGIYKVQWDGRNDAGHQVASGMYLYQIRSGSFVDAKKMMLVK